MTSHPPSPLRDCALVLAVSLYLMPPDSAPPALIPAALALWGAAGILEGAALRDPDLPAGQGRDFFPAHCPASGPRRAGGPSRIRGLGGLPYRLRAAAAALILAFLARRSFVEGSCPASLGLPAGRVEWVEGTAAEDPAPLRTGGFRLALSLEAAGSGPGIRASARGRAALILRSPGAPVPAGARVRVRVRPVPDRDGSGWVLFAGTQDIEVRGLGGWGVRLRAGLREGLRRSLIRAGGEGGALLEALVLGIRDDLDLDLADAFRKAGCSHILALSGQHLGILAALVSFLAVPVLGRRGAGIAAALLALAFTAFVGPKPSLVRSAAMFAYGAAARIAGRPPRIGNALAAAFLVQCLAWPGVEGDLSFQLSYLALAGLAALSPAFEYLLLPRVPPVPARALAASLAALAAAGPRTLVVFGTLYPAGILAAALAAPLTAAFIWTGLLGAGACAALPVLEIPVRTVLGLLYAALRGTMEVFSRLPALEVLEAAGRGAWACVVAAAALAVYAVPYVDHYRTRRRVPAELRLPPGPGGLPESPGIGDAQALWPELPGESRRPPTDRRPRGGGTGIPRLGDRAGPRGHDRGAAGPRRPGGGLRDRSRVFRGPPGDLRGRARLSPPGGGLPQDPGGGAGGGPAGPDTREPAV